MTAEVAVPEIDIGPFLVGDAAARARVPAEIDEALQSIGFFTIVGHGIDRMVEQAREVVAAFFALPLEEKMRVETPPDRLSRGYNWVGNRSLAYTLGDEAPPDLQEGFVFGPLDADPGPLDTTEAARLFAPNTWPDRPADFRPVLEAYYRRLAELSAQLMAAFALALDLPEDAFADKIDRHTSAMRVIHYPPQIAPPEPGQLRAGAHTDYGTLTILYGDDTPGGLQVKRRDGGWLDVHPQPGALVCNIGDLMARWTNDRWVSNLHRVVNPPRSAGGPGRISMPFFHNANHDAMIECIPSCLGPGEQPTYPPIRFSDLYAIKQQRAETMRLEETS